MQRDRIEQDRDDAMRLNELREERESQARRFVEPTSESLAYDRGFIDALTALAWSKDGTQVVGSGEMTLRQALDSRTRSPFYKG